MLLSIPFPSWLTPEIFPNMPGMLGIIRWYGLMYFFAFGTAYLLYRRQVKERNFPMTDDDLTGLFVCGIVSLLLGARLFSTLIYDTSGIYWRAPWLIFWPFRNGQFTGLMGMSYHGGVIGGALSIVIYSKIKKWDAREIGDMYAASIPLGFTFGRLGNFLNGELYGRITARPWGVVFPNAGIPPWHRDFEAIRQGAEQLGIQAVVEAGGALNFPRHPSQLYQMFFEGIVLWAIIWFFRNRKPFKGFLITLYLSGYGLFRFFIEYFRQPDAHIGYPIQLVHTGIPPALAHHPLNFTTGQILCFIMFVSGLVWAFFASRMKNPEPVRVYPSVEEKQNENLQKLNEEKAAQRKNRRKLRNKLR